MIQERLEELKGKCESLGIQVTEGRKSKIGKADYILALQNYWLQVYRNNGTITPGQEWICANIESPQLAQFQTAIKPEIMETILASEDYMADVKEDGVRILAYYSPEFGFEFFSRNRSVADYIFAGYRDQIYGLHNTVNWFSKSFVLDCELTSINPSINGRIVTDTVLNAVVSLLALNKEDSWSAQVEGNYPLRFKVFDILMFDGKSLMELALRDRIKIRDEVVKNIRSKEVNLLDWTKQTVTSWFELIESVYGGKEAKMDFYREITKNGGEGIIIKDLNAPYIPRDARGGASAPFIKMKRSVSESNGADIDGWISGFQLGDPDGGFADLVGSLDISVTLAPSGNQHVIARCSNIPLELRKKMTIVGEDGKPTIDPKYLQTVVTIDGQDLSARAKRFTHARITSFRSDKKWFDCSFPEAQLDNLIL